MMYADKINDIKMGSSLGYVEQEWGVANRKSHVSFEGDSGEVYELERQEYVKKDFIYILYYRDEQVVAMAGITLAGNFNFKMPIANVNVKVGETRMSELGEYYNYRYDFGGARADNSSYIVAFSYHHLGTDGIVAGYGICDIGYMDRESEDASIKFYKEKLRNDSEDEFELGQLNWDLFSNTQKDFLKNMKTNCALLVDSFSFQEDDVVSFIENELEGRFLYTFSDMRRIYN